ncbi:unnamed protein product [Pseudo-nitzschia multistriata]|nr:unnamed protein product [Pseudo-nitzschia multistriata]
MTGNCLGWLAYAYYSHDQFVLASNIPGILISFWLNTGASKLQYYAQVEETNEADNASENGTTTWAVFTSQDKLLLGVLSFWAAVLVGVGWLEIANGREKEIVGIFVNINLLFFYGAPLQTIKIVIDEKCSDSIHNLTMLLNCTNAGFWGAYGIAMDNIVIYGPNGIGLFLGFSQVILCCIFPKSSDRTSPGGVDHAPLLDASEDDSNTDEAIAVVPVSQVI